MREQIPQNAWNKGVLKMNERNDQNRKQQNDQNKKQQENQNKKQQKDQNKKKDNFEF